MRIKLGLIRAMQTFVVVLIAYIITGAHFVWRDLSASVVDRPGYAQRPTVFGIGAMALAWLPFVVSMPFMLGWNWGSLKRYVFSLVLFVVLTIVGLYLTS
jgi:hypothetical protein